MKYYLEVERKDGSISGRIIEIDWEIRNLDDVKTVTIEEAE